ncbi:MAG: CoA transferase [Acidimicrobiales bacterium]|nr:CoA transferase [Acidimicrobiales bacterium]
MNGTLPLEGLRVVDSADEKAEMAGRLLADLGADVIRVEPPGGAVSRRLPPFHGEESLYFAVRNTNKRSVEIDPHSETGRERLLGLLEGADIWLETSRPGEWAAIGLDPPELSRRFPQLVITSISDFGATGPYRDMSGTDPVLVSLSWMLFKAGVPELPPVLPPGALAYDIAGITGAFAALAGYRQRLHSGRGQCIDLSVMESVAQTTDWGLANVSPSGAPPAMSEVRNGAGPIYPIVRCADGWIRPSVVTVAEWRKLRAWLGEPEELQDESFDTTTGRYMAFETVLRPIYERFFSQLSMIEACEEGQRRRIPVTPLLPPNRVLEAPQYRALESFVDIEIGSGDRGRIASGFYLVDGERVGVREPAPAPASRDDSPQWQSRAEPVVVSPSRDGDAGPFSGLRVLDFGVAGAAPEIARLLGEYGADVIRIESPRRPDLFRQLGGPSGVSAVFASSNRTKRSFGVDFTEPEGVEAVMELVGSADVVVENLPPDTLARWGLGPEVMRAANPNLLVISSQTMGLRGPWREWRGYGANTQPVGGMTALWSLPDHDEPVASNVAFPDHVVGRLGAVAATAYLIGRERSGRGVHVEIAQAEVCLNILADLFLKESLEPGSVGPRGNRSERGARGVSTRAQGISSGVSSRAAPTRSGDRCAGRWVSRSGPPMPTSRP